MATATIEFDINTKLRALRKTPASHPQIQQFWLELLVEDPNLQWFHIERIFLYHRFADDAASKQYLDWILSLKVPSGSVYAALTSLVAQFNEDESKVAVVEQLVKYLPATSRLTNEMENILATIRSHECKWTAFVALHPHTDPEISDRVMAQLIGPD